MPSSPRPTKSILGLEKVRIRVGQSHVTATRTKASVGLVGRNRVGPNMLQREEKKRIFRSAENRDAELKHRSEGYYCSLKYTGKTR